MKRLLAPAFLFLTLLPLSAPALAASPEDQPNSDAPLRREGGPRPSGVRISGGSPTPYSFNSDSPFKDSDLVEIKLKLETTKKRLEDASIQRQQQNSYSKDLQEMILKAGFTKETIAAVMTDLQSRKRELEIDSKMKQLRMQAIRETLLELEAKSRAIAVDDPIAKQMQVIIDIRKQDLLRIEPIARQGGLPQSDLTAAKSALAESQLALLQRQETLRQNNSGDIFSKLNSDLIMLTIDYRELSGRVEAVSTQLGKAMEAFNYSMNLDDLIQREIPKVQRQIEALTRSINGYETEVMNFEAGKAAWELNRPRATQPNPTTPPQH